jgi:hypothetical protein
MLNFKLVVLPVAGLVIGLAVGWSLWHASSSGGRRVVAMHKKLGDGGDSSSPIIISDGSIKFREKHYDWAYSDTTHLNADISDFSPFHFKWLACPPDGTPGPCDNPITEKDLTDVPWTIYLCNTQQCDSFKNIVATIAFDPVVDQNDIVVSATAGYTFSQVVANAKDLYQLCDPKGECHVRLLGASLTVNGGWTQADPCNTADKKCTVKIRYCQQGTENSADCMNSDN